MMVLRGGSEQFIAESERSIHDAMMVVKRLLTSRSVEVSRHLRRHALGIEGKGQLIIAAFARALEMRQCRVRLDEASLRSPRRDSEASRSRRDSKRRRRIVIAQPLARFEASSVVAQPNDSKHFGH